MAKTVTIKKGKRELEVSEKAYRIYYKDQGYKLAGEETQIDNSSDTDVDLFALSAEELKKYKVDDLKAFLDKEEMSYESKATKDELIALIVGE